MSALCGTVVRVLDETPDLGHSASVTEIRRAFKVTREVAWKLKRLANCNAPMSEITNVPSEHGMSGVLESARANGVAPELISSLRETYDEFLKLVTQHADDIETFGLIVNSSGARSDPLITERDRRNNYRTLSRIMGMQASAQLVFTALAPSQTGDRLDCMRVDCCRGVCQIRSGVRWVMMQTTPSARTEIDIKFSPEPLDEGGMTDGGLPIIREFSTISPQLIESLQTGVFREHHCSWQVIGKTGAQMCTTGHIMRNVFPRDESYRANCTVALRTPTENLFVDVLLHKSLRRVSEPRAKVFGDYAGIGQGPWSRSDQPLPLSTEVQHLGSARGLRLPLIDEYRGIVEYSFEKTGWKLEDFDAFRYHLKYPIVPATVSVVYELE